MKENKNKIQSRLDEISAPMVLKSAAGYYIGALYWDEDLDGWYPWTQYSFCYYATEEDAKKALPAYQDEGRF
jgi:hypothetical protein